jgi:hypothetical protein
MAMEIVVNSNKSIGKTIPVKQMQFGTLYKNIVHDTYYMLIERSAPKILGIDREWICSLASPTPFFTIELDNAIFNVVETNEIININLKG